MGAKNSVKKIMKKILPEKLSGYLSSLYKELRPKKSYSQSGEDIIADFVFETLKISKPSYLDIGAHHPVYLSNTFLFYKKGAKGVCIEPDPELFKAIKRRRGRDTCLNVGIAGKSEKSVDYYVLTSKTLNTFSKEEAEAAVASGNYGKQKIEKVIKIPLVAINEVMEKHFNRTPNFVSIDTEGFDLQILKSFDFSKYRPEVICVETSEIIGKNKIIKNEELIDFMKGKDYFVYADTYINSIFVDKKRWIYEQG